MDVKPLGRKAYGSIGHLPGSRVGPGDHAVHEGQARICTEQARDRHDLIVVQEKLDGSCVAVARIGDALHALTRSGWPAQASRFEQHQIFAAWVRQHEARFRALLEPGERLVGEWIAQAHGTRYELINPILPGHWGIEPFGAFDLMRETHRLPYEAFMARVQPRFCTPATLHVGGPLPTAEAMRIHAKRHWPCEKIEGVVYRVHRRAEVDFCAKYVRPDKVDGLYLPEVSGKPAVWNWRP